MYIKLCPIRKHTSSQFFDIFKNNNAETSIHCCILPGLVRFLWFIFIIICNKVVHMEIYIISKYNSELYEISWRAFKLFVLNVMNIWPYTILIFTWDLWEMTDPSFSTFGCLWDLCCSFVDTLKSNHVGWTVGRIFLVSSMPRSAMIRYGSMCIYCLIILIWHKSFTLLYFMILELSSEWLHYVWCHSLLYKIFVESCIASQGRIWLLLSNI